MLSVGSLYLVGRWSGSDGGLVDRATQPVHKLNFMLDVRHRSSYSAAYEQARYRQAHPDYRHALRGFLDELNCSRGGCVTEHGRKAVGGSR